MVNKVVTIMHISAYLFIIITDLLSSFYRPNRLKDSLIVGICSNFVYSVCLVIFGLIVNSLATKIFAITAHLESLDCSLIEAADAATD